MASRSSGPILVPHWQLNLKSTSSTIMMLGTVEHTLACVLCTLGSVDSIEAMVDWTEMSVQIMDGAFSLSTGPSTWSSRSLIVKSRSGAGGFCLSSPVRHVPRNSMDLADSIVTVLLVS